jgi:hypothetical protein
LSEIPAFLIASSPGSAAQDATDSGGFLGGQPYRWFVALLILFFSGLALGQAVAPENPYRIKAAFLRNFAHYVTWPSGAFAGSDTPWRVGILGADPFGNMLETTFQGRREQGRSFEIFRADQVEDLPACQIVFVAYKDAARRRLALAALKNKQVLTVGEAPDFLKEGGIIRFQVNDRVLMSVNLDQARSASLNIPTRMLEVSHEVLENGVVRTVH